MTDPRFVTEVKPTEELFTLTIFNDEGEEFTVIVYLTIWPAAHINYREIYADIKLPIRIAISPECDVKYQLSAALYNDGIRGNLKSVTYVKEGQQITI